ncbi:hypothetical protein FS837_007077 [Tulasnella sp. UAMH 9824]|nr:hypothetical protein FS837_007077 [Tulasnella sp. UAMH 9824]
MISTDGARIFQNPGPWTLPTAQAWERLRRYATRVREVVFHDDSSPFDQDVLPELIGHLAEAHPHETVLPNLQNLCWKTNDRRTLDHVLSFCPPTLERISLIIRGWDVPKVLVEQLVCSLSTLPNLFKALEVDIRIYDAETPAMAVALETFIRSQPGLLELRLPRYPIQDHANVLAACRTASQLHTFSGRTTCLTKDEYREVLGMVAKDCPSLRHLMLNRWCNRLDEVVDAADLAPLFDCPFLEHITLWFNAGLELDDQGIRRMGCAWINLETLILQTEGFKTTPMSCLVAFAESFPVLQRLESPFDRSDGLPSMNEVTVRFRSLRKLVLIGDWIQVDEMPSVAEFLARVCSPEVRVNISLLCIPYYDTSLEEEMVLNKGGSDDQTRAIRHWMSIFHRAQEGLGQSE